MNECIFLASNYEMEGDLASACYFYSRAEDAAIFFNVIFIQHRTRNFSLKL